MTKNPVTFVEFEAMLSNRKPLREEISDWFIKISDDVTSVIDHAGGAFASEVKRPVEWEYAFDRRVRYSKEYVYFYRSTKNPSRLAAVSADKYYKHYLIPMVEYYLSSVSSVSFAIEYLNNPKNDWLSWFKVSGMEVNVFQEWWLSKHGTLLKIGKVLSYIGKNSNTNEMAAFSHFVADRLRQIAAVPYDVQVSSTPSAIYTLPYRSDVDVSKSCMRSKERSYFEIYDDMDTCSIVYITEDGYLVGRALLWDNVTEHTSGKEIKIMDRCYFRNRDILARLLAYAREHGYYVKEYPEKSNCETYFDPEGERHFLPRLSVPTGFILRENSYCNVPYFDTFYFAEEGSDHLTSFRNEDSVELRSIEGFGHFLTGDSTAGCEFCGGRFLVEDLHQGPDDNFYCNRCFQDRFSVCDRCGETFLSHEGAWVNGEEVWCPDCVDDHAICCEECNNFFWRENMHFIQTQTEERVLCTGCFEALEDEFSLCPICGETWEKSSMRPLTVKTNQLSLFDDKPQFAPSNTLVCPECANKAIEKAA